MEVRGGLEEAAALHHQLKALYSCPVCMDFRMASTSTPCRHSFCRKCIEDWVGAGRRGRAACPVCQAAVTRRALQQEGEAVARQIAHVKRLFEVEREEMGGEVDFLAIRVVNQVSEGWIKVMIPLPRPPGRLRRAPPSLRPPPGRRPPPRPAQAWRAPRRRSRR